MPLATTDYDLVKKKLDGVGCGMCLAKWSQVTLMLQNGNTDSCHHPTPHRIPLDEIRTNPSALHNTKFKKERRKEMLEGNRPAECDYCWNIEDSGNPNSDRIFKSADKWSWPHYDKITNMKWDENYNPHYVEVSFSNACNFKCSYCAPQFSSTWMKEIKKHGGYPTSGDFNGLDYLKRENKMPIPHTAVNPYVEAFWKWWPELYRSLHTFRITGGEPLMDPNTWQVMDYIINEPNPNRELELSVNSNLGVSDAMIDRLIDKINRLQENDKVKTFYLFTSADTWGEQAEYIRNGLVFNKFWDNLNKILTKCPKVSVSFMVTYNALSVPNFDKLIKGVYDLKKEYTSDDRFWDVAMDTSYLRWPRHQSIKVLPVDEFEQYFIDQYQLAAYHQVPIDYYEEAANRFDPIGHGFGRMEVEKIKRLHDWFITPENKKLINQDRRDFYKFFNEHDKRRGTDFCRTFPELADFYHSCKEIKL